MLRTPVSRIGAVSDENTVAVLTIPEQNMQQDIAKQWVKAPTVLISPLLG